MYRLVKFPFEDVRKGQAVLDELAKDGFEVLHALSRNQDVLVIAKLRSKVVAVKVEDPKSRE